MKHAAQTIALLLFFILTTDIYASEGPLISLPAPEAQPAVPAPAKERLLMGVIELGIGGGGLLSKGAHSGAVLVAAQAGLRFRRLFDLTLSYRLKTSFPEGGAQSLSHACMLEGRGFLWRGLYLGAGLGVAVSDLRLAPYQEFTPGAAWLLKFGYRHDFTTHFGLYGELSALEYYTKGLYTAIGTQFGASIYF